MSVRALASISLLAALVASAWPKSGANEDPFLQQHCAGCHGGEKSRGDFRLQELLGDGAHGRWQEVLDVLAWDEMPPPGEPGPTLEESSAYQEGIRARLVEEGRSTESVAPLPRALRRLGNTEYKNTIVDLFGVDLDVDEILPPDEVAHGFDVVGEALTLTPTHLERYLIAAERIAALAIVLPSEQEPKNREVLAAKMQRSGGLRLRKDKKKTSWLGMYSAGTGGASFELETEGQYVARFRVSADQAGPDLAAFDVRVDGRVHSRLEVSGERPEERTLELALTLTAGEHLIEVTFANDYYHEKAKDKGERDRNFYLAAIGLQGPLDRSGPTPLQVELSGDSDDLDGALTTLARRVFRHPVDKSTLRPYRALSTRRDPFELRLRLALTAMLVSPNFLLTGTEPGDFHTAAGMAWFLWRSTPDELLLQAAEKGELSTRAGRTKQVRRMLAAARASSLAKDFASQWLQLGRLAEASPDPRRFGSFDEELREAMRAETLSCFDAVLREKRPVTELLDADWTFVNERLASHYGFPRVQGSSMRRVPIPLDQQARRGGLLGQAGPLFVTSNPTRTSPVKRGKWILEALLDSAPPPPPPGVGDLEEGQSALDHASLRVRLEEHRRKPECASCHTTMDALGLALENFDAIGRWREKDGPHAIDARAELPDGRAFETPAQLRALLAGDLAFVRSLSKHLTVYALGRGLTREDERALAELMRSLPEEPTLNQVVSDIVELPGFLAGARLEASSNPNSQGNR